MNSRMDKYEFDTPDIKKRTEKNAELYKNNGLDNYEQFDINSNVSVLDNNAKNIDVNQIRDMLDKKYHENIPQRKSITLDDSTDETLLQEKENTREYDINSILSKAKDEQDIDYNYNRLNKLDENNLLLIDDLTKKYVDSNKERNNFHEEEKLMSLINTITALEIKNGKSSRAADLLDLASSGKTEVLPSIERDEDQKKENTFYTGQLEVHEKDYEDFKEIQEDIKSTSIIIKILIFCLIVIAIAILVYFINKEFNLGLF